MKRQLIERVVISKLNLPVKQPVVTPIGIIDGVRNVIIRIETGDGLTGWGEASPFGPITGDSQESNFHAAQALARILLGKEALAVSARLAEIGAATAGEVSIRSAFDMALHDIAAQSAGMPLYAYLGGERRALRTGITIGLQASVEDTVSKAGAALNAGFDVIKIKVGRPGLEDVKHVAAVRERAGRDVALRIDSNQGWDYPTAVRAIEAMAPLDVQYSEQPLARWDIEGLARLRRRVALPLCADESLFDHRDALRLIRADAVDIFNIKLGKSAGIHTALKIDAIAEAAGVKCMVGCFAESRLGLTAAAHLAAARPNISYLDLDSLYVFSEDPVAGGALYNEGGGGVISLPETPGLGATISSDSLEGEVVVSR